MFRLGTAFASLLLFCPAFQLLASEMCFINDSDRTAIFIVISGTERYEKRLKPKSHEFVLVTDTKDDRVVIAQTVEGSSPDKMSVTTKVVDSKVLREHVNRLNFCYVHQDGAGGLRMDLLAFVCLDVVPHRWGKEPAEEDFPYVKSKLINSLVSTMEIDPKSDMALKKFVLQFTRAEQSVAPALPVKP
jgi:hypothetical protein